MDLVTSVVLEWLEQHLWAVNTGLRHDRQYGAIFRHPG